MVDENEDRLLGRMESDINHIKDDLCAIRDEIKEDQKEINKIYSTMYKFRNQFFVALLILAFITIGSNNVELLAKITAMFL